MADDPDEEDSVRERYGLILGFLRDQRFPIDAPTLTALLGVAALGSVRAGVQRNAFVAAAGSAYDVEVSSLREGSH